MRGVVQKKNEGSPQVRRFAHMERTRAQHKKVGRSYDASSAHPPAARAGDVIAFGGAVAPFWSGAVLWRCLVAIRTKF